MAYIEGYYFFYDILLVIGENFQVKIAQQIEVNLISVIPDTHHAGTVFMNQSNLFIERLSLEIHEGDHG
jgi:hypothetical protein